MSSQLARFAVRGGSLLRVLAMLSSVVALATALPVSAQGAAPSSAADSMRAILRKRAGVAAPAPVAKVAKAAVVAPVAPVAKVAKVAKVVVDPDTVVVRDTVFVIDTVVVRDTVLVREVAATAPAPAKAAPAASAPAPKPATPAPATKPAAPAAAPSRVAEVGFGTLKFNGLLQMHFGANDVGTPATFRIRRAETKVSGRISPMVGWALMFDVSKALSMSTTTTTVSGSTVVTSTSVSKSSQPLQDAILTVDVSDALHIDAGQFRLPLGHIGSGSSANLESVERPMFQADRARGGALGDSRDIGVIVRGPVKKIAEYWFGAFNGSGETQNSTDANNQKIVVGRIQFSTPVKGLKVGTSAQYSGAPIGNPLRKDRIGGEMHFARGPYLVRSEVMRGIDATTERLGGFVLAGYRPWKPLQFVGRVDVWDPNTKLDNTAATSRATDVMFGATWFLAGDNARMQVNLSQRSFAQDVSPATRTLLVNLQTSW